MYLEATPWRTKASQEIQNKTEKLHVNQAFVNAHI